LPFILQLWVTSEGEPANTRSPKKRLLMVVVVVVFITTATVID